MNEFLQRIAAILEVPTLGESDGFKALPQWDSLAVLSVIAMLDANYGVNLSAADFEPINSAGELWTLVQSRKRL
jgi:acyl carrier protein